MARPFWHKSGRYAVMVRTADGKRKMAYNNELTKKQFSEAVRWAESQATAASGRLKIEGEPTLTELRLLYLTWVKRRVTSGEASQHTLDGHRKQLGLVCRSDILGNRTIGDLPAKELTPRVLERLIAWWERGEIGQTTIRNRCASLMAMLNWAASKRHDREIEQLIESNPIEGFELPKATYQGDRYAPAVEVEAFLKFVDEQAAKATGKVARFERLTALLIRVVAETGCRPGEMCVAEWSHYSAEHRAIILPPHLHKTGRKSKRNRLIMFSPETAKLIEWEMAQPDRHPTHIFCHRIGSRAKERDESPHGIPWNSNSLCKRIRALRRDAIAAGVLKEDTGIGRLHLYRLRHTKITNAINAGGIPADVARLSGNSMKTIEDHYLSHRPERLREVSDRLREKEGRTET
jgi:integrase